MNEAIHEYVTNDAALEKNPLVTYTGPMQCFCKRERKNGLSMFEVYEQTDSKF